MHNAGDNILLVFASYDVLGVTAMTQICTECVAAAAASMH
jgi:hypothetical protein